MLRSQQQQQQSQQNNNNNNNNNNSSTATNSTTSSSTNNSNNSTNNSSNSTRELTSYSQQQQQTQQSNSGSNRDLTTYSQQQQAVGKTPVRDLGGGSTPALKTQPTRDTPQVSFAFSDWASKGHSTRYLIILLCDVFVTSRCHVTTHDMHECEMDYICEKNDTFKCS